MSSCWCAFCLSLVHSKFRNQVSSIFFLREEYTCCSLTYLKSQKKCKFSYHTHFKCYLHLIYKVFNKCRRRAVEDNVINIELDNQKLRTLLIDKHSLSTSLLYPCFDRYVESLSYQALRACLRTYNVFRSLYTWSL